MKNKLIYLTKMSISKKIKTKWFLIANIIFFVIIVGLVNIDNIVKFFGGDFEKKTKILIVDNIGIYDEFKEYYDESSEYMKDVANSSISLYKKDKKEGKKEVKEDDEKVLLIIDRDTENYIKAELISNKGVNVMVKTQISSCLNGLKNSLVIDKYEVNENILSDMNKNVTITDTKLDDNAKESDEELILGTIFPIVILPFFMLSMFLISMIGAEVNEEKSSKSMEIIISNVSAKVHFFSKIIAGNVFIIIQGILLILYALFGVFTRFIIMGPSNILSSIPTELTEAAVGVFDSNILNNLIYVIPLTILLMGLTFLGYSLLAGILASMTTNQEDYQQLQTPIIVISMIGYYLAFLSSLFKGSLFIKIAAAVPFISAVLAPVLLIIGQIPLWYFILCILIMVLVVYLLIKYGLRIYKVGILNYSSVGLWKKIFKAVKRR